MDSETIEAQRRLRSGGAAPLARDVVRIEGPEAELLLQGQLSADIAALAPDEGAWSLLLAPTGKVDAWLRVSRLGSDSFVVDVDRGWGDAVLERLERFKLRTKAELGVETDWAAVAVRGDIQVELDHAAAETVLTLPAPWPGLIGWDALAPASAHMRLDVALEAPEVLEALRVECGVPAMGAELTERTIPAEAGQWLIDSSVAFTKGCFVGQELVARIDSRGGNVARHLRGLVIDSDAVPPLGTQVVVDGSVVGEVTSAAESAALGSPIALAYVGRAVEPPAAAVLRTEDGDVPAEVRSLPLVGAPAPTR